MTDLPAPDEKKPVPPAPASPAPQGTAAPTIVPSARRTPQAPKFDLAAESIDAPAVTSSTTEDDDDTLPAERPVDPALLYLIMLGVTVLGLRTLQPDVRFTFAWIILIVLGIVSILLDHLEVEIPTGGDMLWGVSFGLIIGVPLLVIATPQLQRTSQSLFANTSDAFVLQSLVLAMPAAETLFFRGALQPTRGVLFTVGAATVWSIVLFFPLLQVTEFPLVAAVIGFFFVVINFAYSYLKLRFGLFSAWTCQITINLILLFVIRAL
jgi:membrane protease YdiL (CAAX protease family)